MAATSVFISSTSNDLRDHRKVLREALLYAGYHPNDMADFGARVDGAVSACLEEVEESDLFVGIYAWRYGFIPPGSEISITEMELRTAAELGKPCLLFVLDETFDWPAERRDEGQAAEQLQALKRQIDAEWVRTTFTTPDNLAQKVLSSLARLEKQEHKRTREAALSIISGPQSVEDARNAIGQALVDAEVDFDDARGGFVVPYESTVIGIDATPHDRVGLMIEFTALLAAELDVANIPGEVAVDLLCHNATTPLGGVAIDVTTAEMVFRYSLPAAMLDAGSVMMCLTYVANMANDMDDQLDELLPKRKRTRFGRD
jgi:hypothetical protein